MPLREESFSVGASNRIIALQIPHSTYPKSWTALVGG